MRPVTIIPISIAMLCAVSCRSHKTVTTAETSERMTETLDITSETKTTTDTSKDAVRSEQTDTDAAVLSFVEGGGTVKVDPDGAVTISGIKELSGLRQHSQQTDSTREESHSYAEQDTRLHGTNDSTRHTDTDTETVKKPWYNSTATQAAGVALVLAILYLLHLWVKRRNKS